MSINVGLVGYGFGGSVFHAPLIGAEPRMRLSVIVSSRRAQIETEFPGTRVSSSVEELLGDPHIQLVVVTSPSPTHFDIAKAALEAGKNVVIDKPFATRVGEADELIGLAKSKGLLLSAFQNRRWDGDFLTVKQCIADGLLGRVYHFESHFDRFRPEIKPGWKEDAVRGAGILYDLGAHLIDQARLLFGMPDAISADLFPQRVGATVEDYFHLILHYGRSRAILHASALVRQQGPRFAVHGDGGSFYKFGMDVQEDALKAGRRPGDADWGVEPCASHGEWIPANGEARRIPTVPGAYELYYEGVATALITGGAAAVTAAEARDGLLIIEAALRSAAERCTVSLR